jgi:hypothetical protein
LIGISPVNYSRTMVLLFKYNSDIALDLFGILVASYIIDLKIPNISYKLSLNDINRDLLLICNI